MQEETEHAIIESGAGSDSGSAAWPETKAENGAMENAEEEEL
jgi:hypothetical protein